MPLPKEARIKPEDFLPEPAQNREKPDCPQGDSRSSRANMVVAPVIMLQDRLRRLVIARMEDVDPLPFKRLKHAGVTVRGNKIGTSVHWILNKTRHERPAVQLDVESGFDPVFDQEIMRPVDRNNHAASLDPLFDIRQISFQRRPTGA